MDIAKWTLLFCAFLNYGFMLLDGTRALLLGDYIRPKSGKFAGRLGPWSNLVRSIGIHPESRWMKMTFVIVGLLGLFIAFAFLLGSSWAWPAMLAISVFSLWYLVPGTLLSVIQIVLLLLMNSN